MRNNRPVAESLAYWWITERRQPPRTISGQPVWDDQKTESSTENHIKTSSLRWPEDWVFHRGPYQNNQSEMTRRLSLLPRTISKQPVWDDQKTGSSTEDHIKTTSLRWTEDWVFHPGPYQDNQSEMTRKLDLPPRTISRQPVWNDQKTETSTQDHIKTTSLRWPEDWVFHRGPYQDSQYEMTRRLSLPPRTIMHLIDTTSHLRE